jgi:signal transduction histidine kinase
MGAILARARPARREKRCYRRTRMSLPLAMRLAACVGQAMLLLLSLRATGPLALPLALFGADLFVWNFATFAGDVSGDALWGVLDTATSPFTPTFGLQFVLAFVGRSRPLRWLLGSSYAFSGLLAAWSLAFSSPPLARFAPSFSLWAATFLAGVVVLIAVVVVLLARYYRAVDSAEERYRVRLLLLALPVGAMFGATDLLHDLAPAFPQLSQLGSLGCGFLMAVVALRTRVIPVRPRIETLLATPGIALLAVVGYYVVFRLFAASIAMLLLGTWTLTLVVVAATRVIGAQVAAQKERMTKVAVVGRLSAQMAHDLKNPLAALQGATQFLAEERRRGKPLDAHADFLELIGEQVARMGRIVDDYHRIGRVEPVRTELDVGALVREVAALSEHAKDGVTVQTEVEAPLPTCQADRDLLARALENLVRNAIEAMPDGGTLTMGARVTGAGGDRALLVTVGDTGVGMDARTRERAFEDFFSTKAAGTGLGLAFVQRVAESHGGSVRLDGALGRGTVVTIRLPIG